MRLDRDRSGSPALDRLQRYAHLGRGHARARDLDHVWADPRALRRARRDPDHLPAGHVAEVAERRRGVGRRAVRARIGSGPRTGGGVDMSEADAVAGVLLVGATMYAIFGGADFGAGVWS